MNTKALKEIFKQTDFVHRSGTAQELQVAEYLRDQCVALGASAWLEPFAVPMGDIEEATVLADGRSIPCKGFFCCGTHDVEADFYYMPGTDPVSLAGAKGKIVLLDASGIRHFLYQDIVKAGAVGLLFQCGETHRPDYDIDERDLRAFVVSDARKLPCAMLHVRDAIALVKQNPRRIHMTIRQHEYEGESRNVVAELPGERDEWIVMSAHYDTTALSHGAYDNMTGCAGLLGTLDALRGKKHNYGLRLVFCGSEERGLLGSKAYVRDRKDELDKIALNINLDMIGSRMGQFIACVSAEEKLAGYLSYFGAEVGFPISTRIGVYSSDSTSFADGGVPAVSLARVSKNPSTPIHCRYDRAEVLSMDRLAQDIAFIAEFTRRMADAAVCPVSREFPEKVRVGLDEYLNRKRKEE